MKIQDSSSQNDIRYYAKCKRDLVEKAAGKDGLRKMRRHACVNRLSDVYVKTIRKSSMHIRQEKVNKIRTVRAWG